MDRSDFAARIKEKYPQYAGMADDALIDAVIAKHPQYATTIITEDKKQSSARKLLDFAHETAAPAAGAALGSALGTPAGPPGMIAGAMLGGAGGKAYQKISDYVTGYRNPADDTSWGAAKEIGMAGLAEGAGQGALHGLATLKPLGSKLGAGFAKIATAVPEKYGEAAFADPRILWRAKSKKAMGRAYDVFENRTGLRGLQRRLVSENRATAPTSELENLVIGAANKVASMKEVSAQELYEASQAAAKLKLMAKYGEPQANMAAASGSIKQAKQIVDDALGKIHPGYGTLRKDLFESKVKEAFSNILPLNKGGTTNVLRPALVLSGLISKIMAGGLTPAGAATALSISPAAWGAGLRTLPVVGAAGRAGVRIGAAKAVAKKRPDELP